MKKYLILFVFCIFNISAQNATVDEISTWIGNAKKAILAKEVLNGIKEKDTLFLTFWNFDNTILDGDTSEGSQDLYGKVIFKGIAQVAIESGLSKKYSSFKKFWKDYTEMEETDKAKANSLIIQMLSGAKESKILELSTNYFASTLKGHLFQNSIDLLKKLQNQNIEVHIVTASPKIFVAGVSPLINIPLKNIHGLETTVKNGTLTEEMIFPLTMTEGKIKKIEQIVEEKRKEYKNVYVLGGVGNYNLNDMPFLKWIATLQLPAGNPLAVVDFHPPRIFEKNMVLFALSKEAGDIVSPSKTK